MNKSFINKSIILDVPTQASKQKNQFLWDALSISFACLLIAISAQITVPLLPVPATLQDMTIIVLSLLMGPKRGVIAVMSYLALGLSGAPVFANLMSGPQIFLSPVGGYLIGFIPMAYLAGLFAEKGWVKNSLSCFVATFTAMSVLFAIGTIHLVAISSVHEAITIGVLPFIGISFVKLIVLSLFVPMVIIKSKRT
jgi:biotin transport system substrate-specific component